MAPLRQGERGPEGQPPWCRTGRPDSRPARELRWKSRRVRFPVFTRPSLTSYQDVHADPPTSRQPSDRVQPGGCLRPTTNTRHLPKRGGPRRHPRLATRLGEPGAKRRLGALARDVHQGGAADAAVPVLRGPRGDPPCGIPRWHQPMPGLSGHRPEQERDPVERSTGPAPEPRPRSSIALRQDWAEIRLSPSSPPPGLSRQPQETSPR